MMLERARVVAIQHMLLKLLRQSVLSALVTFSRKNFAKGIWNVAYYKLKINVQVSARN